MSKFVLKAAAAAAAISVNKVLSISKIFEPVYI